MLQPSSSLVGELQEMNEGLVSGVRIGLCVERVRVAVRKLGGVLSDQHHAQLGGARAAAADQPEQLDEGAPAGDGEAERREEEHERGLRGRGAEDGKAWGDSV